MFEFGIDDRRHTLLKPATTCPFGVEIQITYQHQVTMEILVFIDAAPRGTGEVARPQYLQGYVIGVAAPSFVSSGFGVTFLRHIALTNLRLSTGF